MTDAKPLFTRKAAAPEGAGGRGRLEHAPAPLTAKMSIDWRRFDRGVRSSLLDGRTEDGVVFTLIAPVAPLT